MSDPLSMTDGQARDLFARVFGGRGAAVKCLELLEERWKLEKPVTGRPGPAWVPDDRTLVFMLGKLAGLAEIRDLAKRGQAVEE